MKRKKNEVEKKKNRNKSGDEEENQETERRDRNELDGRREEDRSWKMRRFSRLSLFSIPLQDLATVCSLLIHIISEAL